MLVSRVSAITGIVHVMEIPVPKYLEEYLMEWIAKRGIGMPYVQVAFPMLNADQREFIISGVTPEEWKEYFGEEE